MASKRSCRSHSTWEGVPTNAQQQALLIRAQSRMLKMECELSQLRREAAAGRLVQTSCLVTKDLVTEQNIEREHKVYLLSSLIHVIAFKNVFTVGEGEI